MLKVSSSRVVARFGCYYRYANNYAFTRRLQLTVGIGIAGLAYGATIGAVVGGAIAIIIIINTNVSTNASPAT